MKKTFMLVALFCMTTLITNAEPIKDKDFEQFFIEFQTSIKKWKGDPISITMNIDDSVLKSKCTDDDYIFGYIQAYPFFVLNVLQSYKDICKLSFKNNWKVDVKFKTYTSTWEISFSNDKSVYEKYRINSVYILSYGNGEGSIECVFGKINNEWKIINFILVG